MHITITAVLLSASQRSPYMTSTFYCMLTALLLHLQEEQLRELLHVETCLDIH